MGSGEGLPGGEEAAASPIEGRVVVAGAGVVAVWLRPAGAGRGAGAGVDCAEEQEGSPHAKRCGVLGERSARGLGRRVRAFSGCLLPLDSVPSTKTFASVCGGSAGKPRLGVCEMDLP